MRTSKKRKVIREYKVWVHIEEWVNGEPVSGDDVGLPLSVQVPKKCQSKLRKDADADDHLVDSFEVAERIQRKAAEILLPGEERTI